MADKIYPLAVTPGIQRDGTLFSSQGWNSGEWCRFYRSLPQKIGGYVQIGTVPNIPRGIFVVPVSPNFNVYVGDFQELNYYSINPNGVVIGGPIDRTPVPFSVNPNNLWSFDVMYSTTTNRSSIVAHVAPNLYSIDSNANGAIFFGDTYTNDPLVATGTEVSGGIVVLHPYLFMFGNNGEVLISAPNDPTTIINSARVTGQKIVAGMPTRGGNSSPAGLLWSLDSVIRATLVGDGPEDFRFDTISSESSILSSRSVIEYDSFYYWIGVDRFLYYDGTVRELPNSANSEYFFKNINYSQRQKVWATKVTRWGEIWWHYPSGNSTECDSAIIYNVREKCWYDTKIYKTVNGEHVKGGRSSGYFDQTFVYPIWGDSTPNSDNRYPVWMHENGVNQNIGNVLSSIRSNIETMVISWTAYDPNNQRQDLDRWMELYRVEPDFIQSGPMSMVVSGKEYANSPSVVSDPYIFYGSDSLNPTKKIDLREQRRQMTLTFESDVVGGNFTMGQILMVARPGDVRS